MQSGPVRVDDVDLAGIVGYGEGSTKYDPLTVRRPRGLEVGPRVIDQLLHNPPVLARDPHVHGHEPVVRCPDESYRRRAIRRLGPAAAARDGEQAKHSDG